MTPAKRPHATAPKGAKLVRGVRGFGAVSSLTHPAWQQCRDAFALVAHGYGCSAIELPVAEVPSLYSRAWAKDEPAHAWLMSVRSDGGEAMVLRPTARESVVRSTLEAAGDEASAVQKLSYWTPVFRLGSEAVQQWQYGIEVVGDADPIVDAQCIIIAWRLLQALRIPANVQVNSIGCASCRPVYLRALGDYIRSQRGSLGESAATFSRSPWRLLSSSEPAAQAAAAQAPQTVDYLCPACNSHLVQVLEYLDEVEVPYALNSRTMPEWDYASRTVFSLSAGTGSSEAPGPVLISGCRYDELVTRLGGSAGSAVGFSASVELLVQQVESAVVGTGAPRRSPHVLLAQLGPEARKHAIVLFEQMRTANILVAASLGSGGLKLQLEEAGRLGVRYAAIIGQREILDGTVLLRDMENGIQEVVDRERLVAELVKRLTREAAQPTA